MENQDGKNSFAETMNVSRETLDQFQTFEDLLVKWQKKINLVSASTLPQIWTRHFLDSAQLSDHIPSLGASVADIGSGAGFPGLALAILRPDLKVSLIESDLRKSVFLREVATKTDTRVDLFQERVEGIAGLQVDYVTARACAPLAKLLEWSKPLLNPKGQCLYLKGEKALLELTGAQKQWMIKFEATKSLTNSKATILKIDRFERVGD
jgi:16S rRNA (guanine527-N7)-methyltransferase